MVFLKEKEKYHLNQKITEVYEKTFKSLCFTLSCNTIYNACNNGSYIICSYTANAADVVYKAIQWEKARVFENDDVMLPRKSKTC